MKNMTKVTKIISILMIVMMLVSCFSIVFAATSTDPDIWKTENADKIDDADVRNFSASVINIVSVVGSAAAIVTLIVLGIKYMMGSAEEKAEYKKTLLPYVIGAAMVFGASVIVGVVYNFMNS